MTKRVNEVHWIIVCVVIAKSRTCRWHSFRGTVNATYYNWKAKYGGMTVSDAKRLKSLEDENRRLKQVVADLTLDNQALKAVVAKKF